MARTTRKARAIKEVGASQAVDRKANHKPDDYAGRITLVGHVARWDIALAAFAWLSWFGAHFAGPVADVAIPAWVVAGMLLGLLRPRIGLLLTILIVPYFGGAAELPKAELLRVIPILGAAVRVVVERLRGQRSSEAPRGEIVVVAVVCAVLFLATAFTAYRHAPDAETQIRSALFWLLGGPVAFLAAWLTAAHDSELPDELIANAVLVSTVAACLFALLAWWGAPWTGPFAFPAKVDGRLAALGYPTPTGIGVAIALPFAVGAAYRLHLLAALVVLALGLTTVVLTASRGPLIALAVAGFVAIAIQGRLNARMVIAGGGTVAVSAAALVAVKYGTTPQQILDWLTVVNLGDGYRVQSWWTAVDITLRHPLTGGGFLSLSRAPEFGSSIGNLTSSHNLLLNSFAEGGLPLGISFGAVVLYSVAAMWSNRRSIAPWSIASAAGFFIAGLWDIPNLRSYGAVIGGIALGLVARNLRQRMQSDNGP